MPPRAGCSAADCAEANPFHCAMAAASDASFAVIRAKPLSLGAMNTLFLARRGVEGPLQVIEGPNGIDNLLHMQIRIDWDKQGYEGVLESTIKKYNSMIHTQSAVHCMVELVRQNKLDPGKVVSIEADVIRIAYDFAGGGLYGVDKVVRTKEQADHSLPYLLAVALLDGATVPVRITRFSSKPPSPVTSPTACSRATCISASAGIGTHSGSSSSST
jgi:2-methylcitrate dehydratase